MKTIKREAKCDFWDTKLSYTNKVNCLLCLFGCKKTVIIYIEKIKVFVKFLFFTEFITLDGVHINS